MPTAIRRLQFLLHRHVSLTTGSVSISGMGVAISYHVVDPWFIILHKHCPTRIISVSQSANKPIQTFVKAISRQSRAGLNITFMTADTGESQGAANFFHRNRVGKILLVGEYQYHGVP